MNVCRKLPIAILSFLVLSGGYSPAGAEPDLEAGRRTFAAICSSCHGMDGRATLSYAPSFARGEALDQDDSILIRSVRDGINRMPPWGAYLTEEAIADAIAYARTLQER